MERSSTEFFVLRPEVAGGLGPKTVMDCSTHPPRVDELHYVFDGWLGDELLETFPCFIATQALWTLLDDAGLSGVRAGPLHVSASEQYVEMYPERVLPPFVRLLVTGTPGKDDLGLKPPARLVASRRALDVLRRRRLEQCDVEPVSAA